jgi:thiamine-phosphate pyrophosphorylase
LTTREWVHSLENTENTEKSSIMDASILRLLDANANRAREALRVLEDYARFVLNSEALSGELKNLRHDFVAATMPFLSESIPHRDTVNDIGTGNKTAGELRRDDLGDVVTAAGKRLGEALRALGEYAKIVDAGAAGKLESLRYRFYTIEQTIALTLRPRRFDHVRLYVLITESVCKVDWLTTAEQAIAGGADCLQLREKELEAGELLRRAKTFVALCKQHNVISIINDRADIAMLAGADGVHVGQSDLPGREARKLIGPEKLLGVSTHNIVQARQAVLDSADYVGVGPVFPSATKPRDFLPGLDYAKQAAVEISIPCVAIAGIKRANLVEVLTSGIRAVAVTAAVAACDDVAGAARELKQQLVSNTGGAVEINLHE